MKKSIIVSIDSKGRVKETKRLLWTAKDAMGALALGFIALGLLALLVSSGFWIAHGISSNPMAKDMGAWICLGGICSFFASVPFAFACVALCKGEGVEDD